MIEGVFITPQNIIETPGGDVMHAMRSTDQSFCGFGEAYFSSVEPGAIKGWKKHKRMVSNILVPVGKVLFVLFDNRTGEEIYQQVQLSKDNYSRLTVPPNIWMSFKGCDESTSLLLNLPNIVHDPEEEENLPLSKIYYDWDSTV